MAQIKQHERGKWFVRVYLGLDATGKPQAHSRIITGTKKEAQKWANDRERERDLLGAHAVDALQLTVAALLDAVHADYRINARKSLVTCELLIRRHVKPFFGKLAASCVGTDEIKAYIAQRQASGAANATINRELSVLRRAFILAVNNDPPKIAHAPKIPKLTERNVRQGFFEAAQYSALMAHLPDSLRPLAAFDYRCGLRAAEAMGLRWDQVDLLTGCVRLNVGETKNDESRVFYMAGELLSMMRMERGRHDAEYPWSPWVFSHDGGNRWRTFKASWETACKAAGLWDEEKQKKTRLFHDFRRTAVRNMVRAGIPETVAMRISGHKTRAVFDRYNIISETDLKDAARATEAYLTGKLAEVEHYAETRNRLAM